MEQKVLPNVTAVSIGGHALLIAGAPAIGKSSLALALIDRGATLIGDDAVSISCRSGVLWAAPPPNTAGLIEVRNVGLVEMPTAEAPAALMLTLTVDAPRLPLEIGEMVVNGIALPNLLFWPGDTAQALRAELALRKHGRTDGGLTENDR